MKKYFILFVLPFFLSQNVSACESAYKAINHTTKECGYYYTPCADLKGDILKIVPLNNWEFADNSISNFAEYCKSINYTFPEKNIPYKEMCCTWKAIVYILVLTSLLTILILLILSKKKE